MNKPKSAEQKARDMLERMGVEGAQNFSAGELVELANLIADSESMISPITPGALSALYEIGHMDDAPMGIDCESTWRLIKYAADLSGLEVDQVKDGDKFKLVFKPKQDAAGKAVDIDDWLCEGEPGAAGWYAIMYSWDVAEGVFVGAGYWDGKAWEGDRLPISAFSGPHATEQAAKQWAAEHDLGL